MTAHQAKQPRGMYILGFTEIFERLSYYTLAFLLVLYASESIEKGGLGWSKESALSLVGVYTLGAYTLPLLGGLIADKFLGTFRAAVLGALMIIAGHACMAFSSPDHLAFFYTALALVASGTAFFKPSMPTLLGRLYRPTDTNREGGFNLYYMGINVGAMLAGFSSGTLQQHFGYHTALASAGVGMVLGLIVFLAGKKHLVTDSGVPQHALSMNADETSQNLQKVHSSHYKKAFYYLMLSFVFFAIWAIVYNLAISGTLAIYIENFTNKTVFNYDIPTTFFMSLESVGIIVSAPLLTFLFAKLAQKKKPVHFFSQMSFAVFVAFLGIAYFTYLSYIAQHVPAGQKPFHFIGIALFILSVSVSEVLMSPVMMSSISLLSPDKYKTLFQAFYLTVFGVTGLIASRLGAISLEHPVPVFAGVSVLILISLIAFLGLRKKMVTVARFAAAELEQEEKAQIH